jgi:DNA-binding response OmpR family regulator
MQNHHILVIEDDAVTLEYMEEFLSLYGYQVTPWNTSARAVEQVARCQPDLVILDQRLDRAIGGWEILQALHSQPATADIPVILYSAENAFLHTHRDRVLAMGGDVVNKPFLPDELLEKIRELIKREPLSLVHEEPPI